MTEHDSRGENGSRSVVERGTNVSQMEDGLQMLAADPESQDMADSVEPSNHSFQPPYRIQRWNTEYDFYQVGQYRGFIALLILDSAAATILLLCDIGLGRDYYCLSFVGGSSTFLVGTYSKHLGFASLYSAVCIFTEDSYTSITGLFRSVGVEYRGRKFPASALVSVIVLSMVAGAIFDFADHLFGIRYSQRMYLQTEYYCKGDWVWYGMCPSIFFPLVLPRWILLFTHILTDGKCRY